MNEQSLIAVGTLQPTAAQVHHSLQKPQHGPRLCIHFELEAPGAEARLRCFQNLLHPVVPGARQSAIGMQHQHPGMTAVVDAPAQLRTSSCSRAVEHGGAAEVSHLSGLIPASTVTDNNLQLPLPTLQIRQQQRKPVGFLQGRNHDAQPCHGFRSLQ